LVGCSLLVTFNSIEAAEQRQLGANSRNQIESLSAEKAARSPSERKLDSQLIYALRLKRQQRVAPGLDRLESAVRPRPDGQVLVDLRARVEPELLAGVPKDQSAVKLTEILQSRTGEQKLRVTRVEPIHDSENELKGYAAFAQP